MHFYMHYVLLLTLSNLYTIFKSSHNGICNFYINNDQANFFKCWHLSQQYSASMMAP